MAKRPTLADITTGHGTTTKLNANFDAIEVAFDNTLSRDGSSPNAMEAALDMNSNQILNLPDATTDKEPLTYGQYIAGGASAVVNGFRKETQTATSGQTVFTVTSVEWVPGIDNLIVFVNGELQGPGLYTVNSSTQITFTSGLSAADRVDFVVMQIATTQINTTIDAGLVSYNPLNTTNVTNVETKLREFVSVKDFGAIGDGIADDTAAIQAAIDAVSAQGGSIYIPTGQYKITATLKVTSDDVVIFGEGASSQLRSTLAINILAVSNTADLSPNYVKSTFLRGVQVKDIGFASVANAANGLYVNGVVNGIFSNLYFSTLNYCVFQKHADTCTFEFLTTPSIEDVSLDSNVIIYSDGLVRSNDNTYQNITMRALATGISLGASTGEHDGANIIDNIIFRCDAGSGIVVYKARWSNIANNKVFITSGAASIYLNQPAHVNVTGNLIAWPGYERSTITHGIYVESGAGSPSSASSDVVIADNQIIQPTGHGIYINRMACISITGNLIGNPSDPQYYQGSPTNLYLYNGVRMSVCRDFTITANSVYRVLSGVNASYRPVTWQYCVYTDANCFNAYIENNSFYEGIVYQEGPRISDPVPSYLLGQSVDAVASYFNPYDDTIYSNVTANLAVISTAAIASGYPVDSPASNTAINVAFPSVSGTNYSIVECGDGNSCAIGSIIKLQGWIKTTSATPQNVQIELQPNTGATESKTIIVSQQWQYFEVTMQSDVVASFSRIRFGSLATQGSFAIQIANLQTVNNLDSVYPVHKITYASAAPTVGYWHDGDIAYNTAPAAGGFVGWACTTPGAPGIWKTFGAISV